MPAVPIKGIKNVPVQKGSGQFTRYYKLIKFDHKVHMTSMKDSNVYPNRQYPQHTNVKECILFETADINIRNEKLTVTCLLDDDFKKGFKLNDGKPLPYMDPLTVKRMDPKANEKGVMMLIRVVQANKKESDEEKANDILLSSTRCVIDAEKRSLAWEFPRDINYKLHFSSVRLQLIVATFNDATGLINRDREYEIKGHLFIKQQRSETKPKIPKVSSSSTTLAR